MPPALSIQSLRMHVSGRGGGAVERAVEMQEGLQLIQGPPGTGKTSTIVALLHAYARIQHRPTLVTGAVCSP
jgi:type II secretory ATPase GspE/PulE/Tfp pilus assembly ATPase PilB-like protein